MSLDTLIKKLLRRSTAMFTILLTAFFITTTMPHPIHAAPGDLDTTFGAGRVTTQIGSSDESGFAVAVQPDGKIVVSGKYYVDSSVGWLAALVRYNTDGTLDTSFGTGGKVTQNYANNNFEEAFTDVAVHSDGKIVAVGYYNNGTHYNFITSRFNSNGTLDTTFNGGGFVAKDIGTGSDDYAHAVAVQPDGKIVVAGESGNGSSRNSAFVRYNTNGTLDTTFGGGDGDIVVEVSSVDSDSIYRIALQPDGKIVGVGDAYPVLGGIGHFSAVRLTTAGALDNSFDANGMLTAQIGSGTSIAKAVSLQTDGKIVAAGYSRNGTSYDLAVVRYNADGSLDPSFDSDGKVTTTVSGVESYGRGVRIQTDGKIVVAGQTAAAGNANDFLLARYNANGALDTTFDDDGLVIKNLKGFSDAANALALQSDGKIIAAGLCNNGANNDFAVARFNTNGAFDAAFAPGGKVTTAIADRNEDFADLAVQSDGKIIVVGSINTLADANRNFVAARYNTDGTLDPTFSDDGKVTTNVRGDDEAYAVAIQPDGRIVVAGFSSIGTGADFSIVRYNANGTLDTSFSGDGIDVRNISQTITGIADSNDVIKDVLVQSDGKIVVGGYADNGTTAGADFVIVRYNSDGNSLDNTFNGNGIFRSNITGASQSDSVNALALQADGKYVFAGQTLNGTNYSVAVGRVNANGLWDNSFDTDGIALLAGNILARDVVLQPDGKVLVAGNTNGANEDFMLARYTPAGAPDSSFGSSGIVITPVGTSHEAITNIALQADGKIIASGHTINASTGYDFSVARYSAGGALDTSFGTGGIVKTIFGSGNDLAGGLALQADGKIVVGGSTGNGSNNDFALARFVPGADCTFSISPTSASATAAAVSGTVNVSANETYCTWTATSSAAWLTVTGGASGTGSGSMSYSVAANSGAARTGTITVAGQTFTVNQAAAVNVSIPTNLQSLKNNTVVVPVNVTDTTGKGIISYDFRVNYDASVLTPLAPAFDKSGTLSNGFELNVNSATPGQLIVSGYGTQALAGAGALLNLRFAATGTAPACGAVGFTTFQFNDGNPAAATAAGQVCIVNGSVSGTITNPNTTAGAAVPNVTLSASGSAALSTATDASGNYLLEGFGSGTYSVTPSKTGDVNGAILSFDAALVSRYAAQIETLNAEQLIAADVSVSGTVNSYDAALISQYLVGINNPGNAGTWKFTPASRTYTDLTANQPNQNYAAILMGDVSGSWTPPSPLAELSKKTNQPEESAVAVSLPTMNGGVNQTITVPVSVGDVTGRGFLSFDTEIAFDPSILQLDAVAPFDKNGTLSGALATTGNPNQSGRISLSAYGTDYLQGGGALINLKFRVVGQAGQVSPITFERFIFNENGAQSTTTNGQVTVLAPTAANVSVSGRVVTAGGRGISNVRVYLTDSSGSTRAATTTSFGYYRFADVPAGAVYTITVVSKKYLFDEGTRVLNVGDELTEVNFIAFE